MKLSVVIPLYNKRKSIFNTLESVTLQTVMPEEIIVVNDGSTDGSELIVESLCNPLVKLINQDNSGVSSARNRGVEAASGDWIAFIDADDIWLPDYMETIVRLHVKYPDCKIIATSYFIQNLNGRKKIILNGMSFDGEEGVLSNYFAVCATSHPPLFSSAVVIKREALIYAGGFPTGITSGEDLLTWAKLAAEFRIAYSKKPLSVFIHDDNQGSPTRFPQVPDVVGKELITLKKQHPDVRGIKKYISHWFKMRASIYLRYGMRKNAFYEILRSLSYDPFKMKLIMYLLILPLPLFLIRRVFVKFGN